MEQVLFVLGTLEPAFLGPEVSIISFSGDRTTLLFFSPGPSVSEHSSSIINPSSFINPASPDVPSVQENSSVVT